MTVQPAQQRAVQAPDLVHVTIDEYGIDVPKGTLIIRAAEMLGIQIPRFCDHPLLDPIGACRQCLVHVEGQAKPPASCTTQCTEGMVVRTQRHSEIAEKAQRGIMEMLLVNHPLDCPMCDKGGECPLQNQAMSTGEGETRFTGTKRRFAKPIALSAQVLLDRERCVQCARCTRFADQIAGDPLIDLIERGPQEQVGIADGVPFDSYFSGNTIQICPVGALTGASYRFRARPFDTVSTPSVCEHCASGCLQRTDHRRGAVTRRLAGSAPDLNEEWNCDKGRWAFTYATMPDRLVSPLVRGDDGVLHAASWPEALDAAARGLLAARGRVGVLTGGRLTLEDAYAYSKFARLALGSNDIDMRARPHSAEETDFLAGTVAGRRAGGAQDERRAGGAQDERRAGGVQDERRAGGAHDEHSAGVSYASLEKAPAVLLVGFEPQDESPIVFLRLRKAAKRKKAATEIYSIAAFASDGLVRMLGKLLPTPPGGEAAQLDRIAGDGSTGGSITAAGQALGRPGSVILAGERLAEVPGALSAAARLAERTGAKLAWVPRRAGERGAVEAGALPVLLPGGRLVADAAARAEVARTWSVTSLPAEPGRDIGEMLAATQAPQGYALVVAGVDPADLPDPQAALRALEQASFIVSLELRASAVTDRADVVFPVAAVTEKAGSFVNWEGRLGQFGAALAVPAARSDLQVLNSIADAMDIHLGLPDAASARRELTALGVGISPGRGGAWTDERGAPATSEEGRRRLEAPRHAGGSGGSPPRANTALLATWHNLLDAGRMQDGEPHLAGTARAAVAKMSAATAAEAGVADGAKVTVSTSRGAITVPAEITAMPDGVVWLPSNSAGCAVRSQLGAGHGSLVTMRSAE